MESTTSECLVSALESAGIQDAFVVTGGAIAGFTEALAGSKIIKIHYMLTEQSAAIAAEAYGQFDGNPALLVVTSGPGVTNALTGVAAAWMNSTPMIVISGQARSSDVSLSRKHPNRQWGSQHVDTHKLVQTITKFVVEPLTQFDAKSVGIDLVAFAKLPRMGPVWLSFPSDLQRSPNGSSVIDLFANVDLNLTSDVYGIVNHIIDALKSAAKPVILIGNGSRVNKDILSRLEEVAAELDIALLTTWTGLDLISDDAKTYFGRPGTIASSRVSNFAVQNADLLIVLGARLDLAQIGFRPNDFASQARVIRIDIDPLEFLRISTRDSWTNYFGDATEILKIFLEKIRYVKPIERVDWIHALEVMRKLPTKRSGLQSDERLSTYSVVAELDSRQPKFVVLGSSGTCVEMVLQSWRVTKDQRFLNSGGLGSMGFALGGSIGISIKTKAQVLVIESDGSLAMNIQDFETISRNRLNVKIVILDSAGYKSIKLSQKRQGQKEHGTSSMNGVFLPDASDWSKAAGIESRRVSDPEDLETGINWLMDTTDPRLLQVMVSESEEAIPRLISKLNHGGIMETSPFTELWPEIDDNFNA